MLAYHEFGLHDSGDVYHLSPAEFREQVGAVQSISTSDLRITFDDGHLSQLRHAVPVLRELGARAIFFVTTGWIGVRPEIMQWSHVRELCAQGYVIGTHGHTHALLTSCTPSALQEELYRSKAMAEDKLGFLVDTISMPGGRVNKDVLDACRDLGYRVVYTSCPVQEVHPPWYADGEEEKEIQVIGRLVVRRGMTAAFIQSYIAGDKKTLLRLRLEYRLKQGVKLGIGDNLYQSLWGKMFRVKNSPRADVQVP